MRATSMRARPGTWAAVVVTAVAVVSACAPAVASTPDPAVVATDHGAVGGVITGDVRRFDGIPYAQPPIGQLRWQLPQPVPHWEGVRPAKSPGSSCTQAGDNGAQSPGSSEDCLYLNVTAPVSADAPLPVVVWLHGGGYSSGSGADYNPARMAAAGAVVVTVNSRLGVFGFFGHPDLPDSGTYGLADQQAAMRWVQANAAAFGGDRSRVLLAGQSSGGISVCGHLASPAAAGLFQRAAIHSGPCKPDWPGELFAPGDASSKLWIERTVLQQRGREAGSSLATRPNCPDPSSLGCLRDVPAEDLLALNGPFHSPAYNTPLIPTMPWDAFRAGRNTKVPVLEGTTRDEHTMFTELFELGDERAYRQQLTKAFGAARADRVAAEYPITRFGGSAKRAFAAVGGDFAATCPALEEAKMLGAHTPTYTYQFADPHPPGSQDSPSGADLGAYHGSELLYLFDMGDSFGQLTVAQRQLSSRMINAWITFAATGKPVFTDGTTDWPRFDGNHSLRLEPGRSKPADVATEHHCRFWAQR
ncbi:carboxylesterase/lipase family protein [Allokutzneria oryzae]|uniref:Carboxylic ester hydrolase n=1 Tax=Allokutzneria oryzae TaxID=1378989 RepID=A0ABV6A3Q5_9PSEU